MAVYTIMMLATRDVPKATRNRYDAKLFTPLITGSTFILKDFELKIAFVDFGKTYVRSPTLETSNVAPVSAARAFNAFCVSNTLAQCCLCTKKDFFDVG